MRLVAVIDGTNLRAAIARQGLRSRVDFRRLVLEVAARARCLDAGPAELQRVVYVTAAPIQSHGRDRYARWRRFQALLEASGGVSLRLGRLEGPPGQVHEKGVDILVALELLRGAYRDEYDAASLVAGDGDYADVAAEVRSTGRPFVNAFFRAQRSYRLAQSATEFVALEAIDWKGLEIAARPER